MSPHDVELLNTFGPYFGGLCVVVAAIIGAVGAVIAARIMRPEPSAAPPVLVHVHTPAPQLHMVRDEAIVEVREADALAAHSRSQRSGEALPPGSTAHTKPQS